MSMVGGFVRPVYHLYRMVWTGLDWLYPPQCGGCGKDGSRWCSECKENTQIIHKTVCQICGCVLETPGICIRCRKNPPSYRAVRSWAIFGGSIRNAIHRLKYNGDIALADTLAEPLLVILRGLHWDVDIVVPVPISTSRKAERGYNQAALLAFPLALGYNIAYRSKALRKVRNTRTQVGLSAIERKENLADAFIGSEELLDGMSVLLVDDVMTSGATLDACSNAMKEAGAKDIYGITLARAEFVPR